jgi:hypothetical protein
MRIVKAIDTRSDIRLAEPVERGFMAAIRSILGALLVSVTLILGIVPSLSVAQVQDNCPVKGTDTDRMQYLIDHLPLFTSVTTIHQAWIDYRKSDCRFTEALLSHWPTNMPLYNKGYSNLDLTGTLAWNRLAELSQLDAANVSRWNQLSQQFAAQGLKGDELIFSMTDLLTTDSDVRYDMYFIQRFYQDGKYVQTLTYDIDVRLNCSGDHCQLVHWDTAGPQVTDDSGGKGISSGAGGK